MEVLKFNFDYAIAIKRVGRFLTISIPDLGIAEKIHLETDGKTCDKSLFFERLQELLSQGNDHIQRRSWQPPASSIKETLVANGGDLTLPEFCKRVQEKMKVSENTLRREIAKGKIISTFTEGGHRRIPESEVIRYLNICSTR